MKRETITLMLNSMDDRYINEAAVFDPESIQEPPERILHMSKKRIVTLALAAALILSFGIVGYAVFSVYSARVPQPEETFRINWEPNPSKYLDWSNAKLAITFPETSKSKLIEFRPSWLPEELASLKNEQWCSRLTAEGLASKYPNMTGSQPLLIETYSMSQFNNNGALLLLYYIPDEIIEEHWDDLNVDVMRFHCTEHFDALPEYNRDAYTLEQDIILMSNADEGWVVRLAGEIGMDQMVKVAKNLKIRETGKVMTYDDFENHYNFMDGGVG